MIGFLNASKGRRGAGAVMQLWLILNIERFSKMSLTATILEEEAQSMEAKLLFSLITLF
jgi:hypothetical protein